MFVLSYENVQFTLIYALIHQQLFTLILSHCLKLIKIDFPKDPQNLHRWNEGLKGADHFVWAEALNRLVIWVVLALQQSLEWKGCFIAFLNWVNTTVSSFSMTTDKYPCSVCGYLLLGLCFRAFSALLIQRNWQQSLCCVLWNDDKKIVCF